jgi:hypothetical protein
VGEIAAGSEEAWRDFFAGLLRRDFEGEVLRFVRWTSLVMRSVAGEGEVEVVEVEERRSVGLKVGSWKVVVGATAVDWVGCGRADSGMRRKDIGSTLLPRGGCWICWSGVLAFGFDKLRAAAAQDRSVFRLDRRASSWWAAALYDGERIFCGKWLIAA